MHSLIGHNEVMWPKLRDSRRVLPISCKLFPCIGHNATFVLAISHPYRILLALPGAKLNNADAGFKQLSFVRLLSHDAFHNQVMDVRAKARRAAKSLNRCNHVTKRFARAERPSNLSRSRGDDAAQTLDPSIESIASLNSTNAVTQIAVVYDYMAAAFAALDSSGRGVIQLSLDGPAMARALSDGALRHLWAITTDMAGGDDVITQEQFRPIFWAWMGIDDASTRVRVGALAPVQRTVWSPLAHCASVRHVQIFSTSPRRSRRTAAAKTRWRTSWTTSTTRRRQRRRTATTARP